MHQIKSESELNERLNNSQFVVLRFTADWCGPCKAIAPVVEKFAQNYSNVEFVEIDVDLSTELASKYKVTSMPTFVFFNGAKEVKRVVGADAEGVKKTLDELVANEGASGSEKASGITLTKEEKSKYIPKGFDTLNDLVHFGESEILNVKKGSVRSLFEGGGDDSEQVQSDADSQILVYAPFQNKTKVNSILLKVGKLPNEKEQIETDEEYQKPSKIKVWANTPGIISFEDASNGVKALHQSDVLEPDENGWIEIKLRYVLFQSVASIVIFLDGEDEDASTVIEKAIIIGNRGEAKSQGKIEAVEE